MRRECTARFCLVIKPLTYLIIKIIKFSKRKLLMTKNLKVHLLINETAGNGNAKKASLDLQRVLHKFNVPFTKQKAIFQKSSLF